MIVLQIIDNIAIAILTSETENERAYNEWSAVVHLIDILSCCAILVPIVWQVNTLEESVEAGTISTEEDAAEGKNGEEAETMEAGESSSSPTESRLQSKLDLFRSFYLIVVAYIYFTRIVIYLFAASLKYNQTWIRYFVYELGTLTFYFVVGIKFRPVVEEHSYIQVDTLSDDYEVSSGVEVQQQQKQQIELSTIKMGGSGKIAKD